MPRRLSAFPLSLSPIRRVDPYTPAFMIKCSFMCYDSGGIYGYIVGLRQSSCQVITLVSVLVILRPRAQTAKEITHVMIQRLTNLQEEHVESQARLHKENESLTRV